MQNDNRPVEDKLVSETSTEELKKEIEKREDEQISEEVSLNEEI